MDNIIINEFYKKILPEVNRGSVDIDGWCFNVGFNTIIENDEKYNLIKNDILETLVIKNINLFNLKLVQYTTLMLNLIEDNSEFHDKDNIYFSGNKTYIIDFILTTLWSNATDLDFQNPINFLQNRINFINNDNLVKKNFLYLENISNTTNNIVINNKLNNPILETPYSFSSKIVNENNEYELPLIYYGISENNCYIYSIQKDPKSKQDEITSYEKKINRFLYKVNKDVVDDYEEENIKDVTPNALMALTIFLKYLRENSIENINVIDYLPIRWDAKEKVYEKKINKLKEKSLSNEELNLEIREYELLHDNLQKNIIDKLLRNFRRLEYQLNTLNITSYPREVDNMMHIKLKNNISIKNDILNDIDNMESNLNRSKKI